MNKTAQSLLIGCLLSGIPILYLLGLQSFADSFLNAPNLLLIFVFVLATLGIGRYVRSRKTGLALFLLVLINFLSYRITNSTLLAWTSLGLFYALLLWAAWRLSVSQSAVVKWLIYGFFSVSAGLIPIATLQIETRFSDEEFSAALQVAALMILWGLLAVSQNLWIHLDREAKDNPPKANLVPISIAIFLVMVVGAVLTVNAYQRSFFPPEAPVFEGITAQTPFICGESDRQAGEQYTGEQVFNDILGLVEANPNKGSPEYGMLALGLNSMDWAQLFHDSLLGEAREGEFTEPAHSVKYSQYEGALRVYYYDRVREVFPALFSAQEQAELEQWFAAINRRAHTIEWVDWLYAIAYGKIPEGPYENQEIGAGLLSLLELTGLSDSQLSESNRAYLDEALRGWVMRFRNTDDAAVYQPEWINNAYFQSLYTQELNYENLENSYLWLLLQAIPDGAPLRYNHVGAADIASTAYQGAGLINNEVALWIAGRAVEYLQSNGETMDARPATESALDFASTPPEWLSCLLYGDSGLPNQKGPLAPDKIVMRDGWEKESTYLLANLRFTGWHRYKATNTVTLIYKSTPIVEEATFGEPFWWLPVGRSLFRDKRIPRENLNGLSIEKTGLSVVVHTLTRIGSAWAQDPPYYASVDQFELGPEKVTSQSRLPDWHGWEHVRQITLFQDGPIAIVDQASGPQNQKAAINWHLTESLSGEDGRYRIGDGDQPAEILLMPLDANDGEINVVDRVERSDGQQIQYQIHQSGAISLLTVVLFDEWVGAQVVLDTSAVPPVLQITTPGKQITQPIQLYDE